MLPSPRELGTDVVLSAAVGVLAGGASALFLWLLERATATREATPMLVFALPVAGLLLGAVLERVGARARGGSDLVLGTVLDGGPTIPARLGPLVLGGTVLTHLVGGSAGREGTAVQMGATLSDAIAHRLRVTGDARRRLLVAGMAAGFGSVFGTPFAGAIFGVEVARREPGGHLRADALFGATVGSIVADLVARALGTTHTSYPPAPHVALEPALALRWVAFAAGAALVTVVFVEATHALKALGARHLPRLPIRMALGGVVLVVLWRGLGTSEYLGLGVPTIVRAFTEPGVPPWAFAAKLVFTAVTLGAGFLGGEVTPLFFVGATFGSAVAGPLGLPLDLAAGVGLAVVFGAAARAPLALAVMAVELLGDGVLPHVALVMALTHVLVGQRSIYRAQLGRS